MLNKVINSISPPDEILQRVVYVENQLRTINQYLNGYYILGRLRTDRTAPVDSDDVQLPDMLYDRVLKDDYEYIVIDDGGALKWRRVTLDVF